jgi:hypothetical protein
MRLRLSFCVPSFPPPARAGTRGGFVKFACWSLAALFPVCAVAQPAWNGMTNHIAAGDIAGAISNICSDSADNYRQAFLLIGTNSVMADIAQIGTLTPVFIKNDRAEYSFQKNIEGQTILFPVDFMKQNGVWKLKSF